MGNVTKYTSDVQISTHFRSSDWNVGSQGQGFSRMGYVLVDDELVEKLEALYTICGITDHMMQSGYRPYDNGSQHQLGKAVDCIFYRNGTIVNPREIMLIARYVVGFRGAANINTNYRSCHLDVREGKTWYADEVRGNGYIDSFYDYYNVTDEEKRMIESLSSEAKALSEFQGPMPVQFPSTTSTPGSTMGPMPLTSSDNQSESTNEVSAEVIDDINRQIDEMFASAVANMKEVGNTSRFIGAPFRFLEETDPSVEYDTGNAQTTFSEGRGYMYHIGAEAPLVHFIPGLPTYAKDFDIGTKSALSEYVRQKQAGVEMSTEILNAMNGIEGRYFDFVPAYQSYIKYANMLCRAAAIYMGIGDKTVPGSNTTYKRYNWANYQNGGTHIGDGVDDAIDNVFDNSDSWTDYAKNIGEMVTVLVENTVNKVTSDIFSGYNSIKCYVDASSSFSEDFSNNTKESAVASLFDTAETAVKEINFWTDGSKLQEQAEGIIGSLTGSLDSVGESILGALGLGNSNLDHIGNYAGHILTGSNIVFPEMWGDSSYTKSYNFSVNLISPYGDPESIYLNVIQPLMMLLPMVLPRQTSGNSYTSPFLVRVFAKGWCSCDMGIVEAISVEKGGSDSWNANGMPLEMKVGIRIKDLYSSMSMADTSQPGLFFNNPTLIEFLTTTCGVNTMVPNISLKVMTMLNLFSSSLMDIPTNMYQGAVQGLNNTVMNWTRLF